MGGRGRVDDQGLGVADIGQVAGQLDMVDKGLRRLRAAANAKIQHRAKTVAQILLGLGVVGAVFQAVVLHPGHLRMRAQPLRQRQGVVHMALHAQRQGFHALQQLERIERRQAGADVAQAFHPGADGKGDIAKRAARAKHLPEIQAVVARRRVGEQGKLAIAPVEGPGVHNHPANRGAMAANPLGGRGHHNIGAMVDRPGNIAGGAKGVVDNQRNAGFAGNLAQGGKVRHGKTGVAQGFHINRLGVGVDGGAEGLRVVAIDKFHADAQARQRHLELVVGAAVQMAAGDNIVTGLGQGGDGDELRRLARAGGHRRHAAFQRGNALLEHVGGRVHDAGVDIAELFQRKQLGAVVGAVKGVRRGLINRHGAGIGAGRRLLAGVHLQGFVTVVARRRLAHVWLLE